LIKNFKGDLINQKTPKEKIKSWFEVCGAATVTVFLARSNSSGATSDFHPATKKTSLAM